MHSYSMGEAPIFAGDQLQKKCQNGCGLKLKGCESSSIVILDKTYVIGGGDDEDNVSLGVRIFDNASGDRVTSSVLGCKPKSCKGHFAIPLNEDRILIIKKGAEPDDCIWFLEVDTRYVREQRKVPGTAVVAWSKGVTGNADKPIVISGPSGVGKGTLISMLMKEFSPMFGFSVSHTTRAPRNKELDGVHYHFIERGIMEKEIKDGKFLEFASVHENLYGTSIEAVEVVADSGKRCILDIDVQGAKSIRASPLEAVFIFICPPSMVELEMRLLARGTESEEQILKRLRNAQAEIEQGKSSAIFDHILYNDKLEECYNNLKKLLGLDGTVVASQNSSSIGISLPHDILVSKVDNKIFLNIATPGLEMSAKNLIVLDVSSLKGGAPGRTRGLDVYAVNSFSDGLDGINPLS